MQRKEKHKDMQTTNLAGLRVGIVAARFNREITDKLLETAKQELKNRGVRAQDVRTVRVAGSVEIPFALQILAKSKKYDFLVALGAVIRGETPHFDYVCKIASEGVLHVMLDYEIPVGFGILTTDNLSQAKKRISAANHAVLAAGELATIKKSFRKR